MLRRGAKRPAAAWGWGPGGELATRRTTGRPGEGGRGRFRAAAVARRGRGRIPGWVPASGAVFHVGNILFIILILGLPDVAHGWVGGGLSPPPSW